MNERIEARLYLYSMFGGALGIVGLLVAAAIGSGTTANAFGFSGLGLIGLALVVVAVTAIESEVRKF